MIREKKSIDGALIVREKKMFLLKQPFETEHENVLSVMYVINSPKDIKKQLFQKGYPSKLV